MSELADKIKHAIEFHTDPIGDYDLEIAKGLILAAFKAHIEECERPKNRFEDIDLSEFNTVQYKELEVLKQCCVVAHSEGVEADRKALMESLECTV